MFFLHQEKVYIRMNYQEVFILTFHAEFIYIYVCIYIYMYKMS